MLDPPPHSLAYVQVCWTTIATRRMFSTWLLSPSPAHSASLFLAPANESKKPGSRVCHRANAVDQGIAQEWLLDTGDAGLGGSAAHFRVGMAGDEDGGSRDPAGAQRGNELETAHARHVLTTEAWQRRRTTSWRTCGRTCMNRTIAAWRDFETVAGPNNAVIAIRSSFRNWPVAESAPLCLTAAADHAALLPIWVSCSGFAQHGASLDIVAFQTEGPDQPLRLDLYQSACKGFRVLRYCPPLQCAGDWSAITMEQKRQSVPGSVVAVVDDDAGVRSALRCYLEVEGFAVHTYADGAEVLSAADVASCACLVIDQNMPGMTGLEVVAKLRDRDVSMPAILITACPNAILNRRAVSAGIPVVEKPFFQNLLEIIHAAVASRQATCAAV
jgi:two-component system response regulator FixJ